MKLEIVGSIIAEDQEELLERIDKVKDHVSRLQFDFFDGDFVETRSFEFDYDIPKVSCMLEAHLMVSDPDSWIEQHGDKFDLILIHLESTSDPAATIQLVKDLGKKVGLAIKPETPVEEIEEHMDHVDEILIMTVQPGGYNAPFLPENLDKVKTLRKEYPKLSIEVDGGINHDTIKEVKDAGANLFVVGSYLQKAMHIDKNITYMKELIS